MFFGKLDLKTLENWLFIPLIFYKRLCDVFDDEIKELGRELGSIWLN